MVGSAYIADVVRRDIEELVEMCRRLYATTELHYVAASEDEQTDQVLEDARMLLGRHGVEV